LRLAIDTNRYSDLVEGVTGVVDIVAGAHEVFVPLIVVAELRAGFAAGTRQARNEGI
jgi:predicted nucleic acid-binding protein